MISITELTRTRQIFNHVEILRPLKSANQLIAKTIPKISNATIGRAITKNPKYRAADMIDRIKKLNTVFMGPPINFQNQNRELKTNNNVAAAMRDLNNFRFFRN